MEKISKLIRCAAKRWAEKRKNTDSPEQKTVETPERIETQNEKDEKVTTQTVLNITENLIFLFLKTSDIFRTAIHCIIRFTHDYSPHLNTEQVRTLRLPLTCFGMTGNYIRLQRILCIFLPRKKVILITENKLEPRLMSI